MSKLFPGLRLSLPVSATINLSHVTLSWSPLPGGHKLTCFGRGEEAMSRGKVCCILLGTRRALKASWMSLTSDDQGWSGSLEIMESHEFSLYPAISGTAVRIMEELSYHYVLIGLPGGSVVKNPTTNRGDAKDVGLTPGLGRSPGVGNGNPLQVFLPGKSQGERSLESYSPRGHKQSDTT